MITALIVALVGLVAAFLLAVDGNRHGDGGLSQVLIGLFIGGVSILVLIVLLVLWIIPHFQIIIK